MEYWHEYLQLAPAYYRQMADIDLTNAGYDAQVEAYIGADFSGVYDGNDFVFTSSMRPLFAHVQGEYLGDAEGEEKFSAYNGNYEDFFTAQILNVTIQDPDIFIGEWENAAALAMKAENAAFYNCLVTGETNRIKGDYVAALIVEAYSVILDSCTEQDVTLEAATHPASLVAHLSDDSLVVNCTTSGKYSSEEPVAEPAGADLVGSMDSYGNNSVYNDLTLERIESILTGSGTQEDPYQIYDADDFYAINYVEYWHEYLQLAPVYYRQMADIDLTGAGYDAQHEAYIGADFAGVYDGNGFAFTGAARPLFALIQGKYIGDESDKAAVEAKFSSYQGNYGDFFTAQIVNVTVQNPNIFLGWSRSEAALAIKAVNTSFYNCHVIGGSISGHHVGALAVNVYSVVIDGCTVENVTLAATARVGGLASIIYSNMASSGAMTNALVTNCSTSGAFSTSAANMSTQWPEVYAGGLLGQLEGRNSKINDVPIGKLGPLRVFNSSSSATVTVSCGQLADYRVGGLCSYFADWVDMSGCNFTGKIVMEEFSGNNAYVGGLVGDLRYYAESSSAENPVTYVRNCSADSAVLPENDIANKMYVGRVAGWLSTSIFDASAIREGDIAYSSAALQIPENFQGPLTLQSNTTVRVPQSARITTLTFKGTASLQNEGSIDQIVCDGLTISSNSGTIGQVASNTGNVVITTNAGTIGNVTTQKGAIIVGSDNKVAGLDENTPYGNTGTLGNLQAATSVTIRRNTGTVGSVTAETSVIIGQGSPNNFTDANCYHTYQINSGTIGAVTAGTNVNIYNNTAEGKISAGGTITAGTAITVGTAKVQKSGDAAVFTFNANAGLLGNLVSSNVTAETIVVYSTGTVGNITKSSGTGGITIYAMGGSVGDVNNMGSVTITTNSGTIGNVTSQIGSISVGSENRVAGLDGNIPYGNAGTLGNLQAATSVNIRRNTGAVGSVTAGTSVAIGQYSGNNFTDANCYHTYQINSGTIGTVTAGTSVSIYNNTAEGKISAGGTITAGTGIAVGTTKAQKSGNATVYTYHANAGELGNLVSTSVSDSAVNVYSTGKVGDITKNAGSGALAVYPMDGSVGNITNYASITLGTSTMLNQATVGDVTSTGSIGSVSLYNGAEEIGSIQSKGAVTISTNSGTIGDVTSQDGSITVGTGSRVTGIDENTPYGNAGTLGSLKAGTSVTVYRNTGTIGNVTAGTSVTIGQNSGKDFTDANCYHTYQINSGTIGTVTAGTTVSISNNTADGKIAVGGTITAGAAITVGTVKMQKKSDATTFTYNANAGELGNLVCTTESSDAITIYTTGKMGDITKNAGAGTVTIYPMDGTVGDITNFAGIALGTSTLLNEGTVGNVTSTGNSSYAVAVYNGTGEIGSILLKGTGGVTVATNSGTIGDVTAPNSSITVGASNRVTGIDENTPYGNAGTLGSLKAGTSVAVYRNTAAIGSVTAGTSVNIGQGSSNNFSDTTCYHTYQINSGTIGAVTAGTSVVIYNNLGDGKIAAGETITAGMAITVGTAKAQKKSDATTFTYNNNSGELGNLVSNSVAGDTITVYSTGKVGDITKNAGTGAIALYAAAGKVGTITSGGAGTVTIGSSAVINGADIAGVSAPNAAVNGITAVEVPVQAARSNTLLQENDSVYKANASVTVYVEDGVTKVKHTGNGTLLHSFDSAADNYVIRLTISGTVTVEENVALAALVGTTRMTVANSGRIESVSSTGDHVTVSSNTGTIGSITAVTANGNITINSNSGTIDCLSHSGTGTGAITVNANSGTISEIMHSGTGMITVTNKEGTISSVVHTGSGAVTVSTDRKIDTVKSAMGLLTLKSATNNEATAKANAPLFGTVEAGGNLTISGWMGSKDAGQDEAVTVKLTNPDKAILTLTKDRAAGYLKFQEGSTMPRQVMVICASNLSNGAYFNRLDFTGVTWPEEAAFDKPAGTGTEILGELPADSGTSVVTSNLVAAPHEGSLLYEGTSIEVTAEGSVAETLYLTAASSTLYNYGHVGNVVFEGTGILSIYNMTEGASIGRVSTTQPAGSVTVMYNRGTMESISANGSIAVGAAVQIGAVDKQVHVDGSAAKQTISCGNDGILGSLKAGTSVTVYRNTGTVGSVTAGTTVTIGQKSPTNFTDATSYHTYQINSGTIGAVTAGTSVDIFNNQETGKIAAGGTITAGTAITVGTAKTQKSGNAAVYTYHANAGELGNLVSASAGGDALIVYSTGKVGNITKNAGSGSIAVYSTDGSVGDITNYAAITIGASTMLNEGSVGKVTSTGSVGPVSVSVYNGTAQIGSIQSKGAVTISTNSGTIGDVAAQNSYITVGVASKVTGIDENTPHGNAGTLGSLTAGTYAIVYRNTAAIGSITAGTYVTIGQVSPNKYTDATSYHTYQINSGTIGAVTAGTTVSIYNNTADGKIAAGGTITAGAAIAVGTGKVQKNNDANTFTYNINAGELGNLVSTSKSGDAITVYSTGKAGDITKNAGSGMITVYPMDGTVGDITNYAVIAIGVSTMRNEGTVGNVTSTGSIGSVSVYNGTAEIGSIQSRGAVTISTNSGTIGDVTSQDGTITVGAKNMVKGIDENTHYGNAGTLGSLKAKTSAFVYRNTGIVGNVTAGTFVTIGQNSANNFTDANCFHIYQINSGTIGTVTAGTNVNIYNNTADGKIAAGETITAGGSINVGTGIVKKSGNAAVYTYNGNAGVVGNLVSTSVGAEGIGIYSTGTVGDVTKNNSTGTVTVYAMGGSVGNITNLGAVAITTNVGTIGNVTSKSSGIAVGADNKVGNIDENTPYGNAGTLGNLQAGTSVIIRRNTGAVGSVTAGTFVVIGQNSANNFTDTTCYHTYQINSGTIGTVTAGTYVSIYNNTAEGKISAGGTITAGTSIGVGTAKVQKKNDANTFTYNVNAGQLGNLVSNSVTSDALTVYSTGEVGNITKNTGTGAVTVYPMGGTVGDITNYAAITIGASTMLNEGTVGNVTSTGSGGYAVSLYNGTGKIGSVLSEGTGTVAVSTNSGTIGDVTSQNGAVTVGVINRVTGIDENTPYGNAGTLGSLKAGTSAIVYRNTGTVGSVTAGTSVTIGQNSGKNFTDATSYHTYQINSGTIGDVTAGTSVAIYNNQEDGKIAPDGSITAGTTVAVGAAKVQKSGNEEVFTYSENEGELGTITGGQNSAVTVFNAGGIESVKAQGRGALALTLLDGSQPLNASAGVGTTTVNGFAENEKVELTVTTQGNVKSQPVEGCETAKVNIISTAPADKEVVVTGTIDTVVIGGSGNIYSNNASIENVVVGQGGGLINGGFVSGGMPQSNLIKVDGVALSMVTDSAARQIHVNLVASPKTTFESEVMIRFQAKDGKAFKIVQPVKRTTGLTPDQDGYYTFTVPAKTLSTSLCTILVEELGETTITAEGKYREDKTGYGEEFIEVALSGTASCTVSELVTQVDQVFVADQDAYDALAEQYGWKEETAPSAYPAIAVIPYVLDTGSEISVKLGDQDVNGCYFVVLPEQTAVTAGQTYPIGTLTAAMGDYPGYAATLSYTFTMADQVACETAVVYHTITFQHNVIGVADSIHYVKSGESITIPEAEKREGYLFAYWQSGTSRYYPGSNLTPTEDMVFSAVRTSPGVTTYTLDLVHEHGTIKYQDANGDLIYISDHTVAAAGTQITLAAQNVGIYRFKEWQFSSEPADCVISGNTVTFTMSANLTVNAQFQVYHNYGSLVARKDATCSAAGFEAHYFCDDCNTYFTSEKAETTAAALTIPVDEDAHSYGAPTYTWSSDYSACTAKRVCSHNSAHVETENGTVVSKVTQEQSLTKDELTTYAASFKNTAFTTQIKANIKTANKLGTATTPSTGNKYDSDSPSTGDATNTGMWLTIALIGAAGALLTLLSKKRYMKRK